MVHSTGADVIEQDLKPLGPYDLRQIGPYRLIGVIGEGGMGRVYLGTSADRIRAAVKVMHSQLARDASFRERFRREVEFAMRVSGRFTARIIDSGVDEETPWLASEYISGPTLEQTITEHGELPWETVLMLAAELAQALMDIHASRVIHRDLKPSNIICSHHGVRVIDFGIAKALDGSATMTRQVMGTLDYMSPEQLRNRQVSEASDIFSLGCVLVYAATQRHPERLSGSSGNPDEIDLRYVPHELRGLISNCVQLVPERRPADDILLTQIAGLRRGRGNGVSGQGGTRKFPDRGDITAMQEAFESGGGPGIGARIRGVPRGYQAGSVRLRDASLRWRLLSVASSRRWARWCVTLSSLSLVEVASRTAQVQDTAHGRLPWLRTALVVQSAIRQFTNWIPDPISRWIVSAGTASRTDNRLALATGIMIALMFIGRRSRRNYVHQVALKAAATYAGAFVMLLMGARLVQNGFGPLIHIAEYLRWWAVPSLVIAVVLIFPLSRAPGDRPSPG
jgi:predicted Ser/Thr protein kinase